MKLALQNATISSVFTRDCVMYMRTWKNNKKHEERPKGLKELQTSQKDLD